jgi:hypothetical protein
MGWPGAAAAAARGGAIAAGRQELCNACEREPITLDSLKRLCHGLPEPRELMGPMWPRLAVDLAQRFDGITVANRLGHQGVFGVAPLATTRR